MSEDGFGPKKATIKTWGKAEQVIPASEVVNNGEFLHEVPTYDDGAGVGKKYPDATGGKSTVLPPMEPTYSINDLPVKGKTEFMVSKDIKSMRIHIGLLRIVPYKQSTGVGGDYIAQPVLLQKLDDPGSSYPDPMMVLSYEDATALATALWHEGVRPADVGGAGELAAVKKHLEDMRTIAMGWVGTQIELKK